MYSRTTGTGVRSAPSGIHSLAPKRAPSAIGIHSFSTMRTGRFGGSRQGAAAEDFLAPNNEAAASAGTAASVPKTASRREIAMLISLRVSLKRIAELEPHLTRHIDQRRGQQTGLDEYGVHHRGY